METQNVNVAADLPVEKRPGVPRQLDDSPVAEAREARIPRQPRTVVSFKHPLRREVSPVFGTASPPRGLSGWMRKAAYEIPEHKARHWLLLLMSDRVDFVEHTLLPKVPFAAALVIGTGVLVRRLK